MNTEKEMKLLYKKLDSLFKMDTNQVALMTYGNFEKYIRPQNITIVDFNIEFDCMVQQLSEHQIKLSDAVLAYTALKNTNLEEDK